MQISQQGKNISRSGRANGTNDNHSHSKSNKRFQACVACRATKTKCIPSKQSSTCQSCLKLMRPCVMPGPAKPRMKSAEKFSELERKIEMLTSALSGREPMSYDGTEPTTTVQGSGIAHRLNTNSVYPSPNEEDNHAVKHPNIIEQALGTRFPLRKATLNVVEEGLMTAETASALLQHWQTNMSCYTPLVLMCADTDVDDFQKQKPLLFLAILTISSTSIHPSLSTRLVQMLTNELAYQTMILNTQTNDLIMAMLLFSQFYFQPEDTSNLAPSRFIYIATAMAADLGIRSKAKPLLNNDSGLALEAARICLGEWCAESVTATMLHRSSHIQHSPEFDKYAAIIEKNHGFPSEWTSSLLSLQKIMEGTSILLNPAEVRNENAFDEPSMQYKIGMLQQKVEAWEENLPDSVDERIKQHTIHTTYLRIHEIAVRCFVRKVAIQKQQSHLKDKEPELDLTPIHFDCLCKCLRSVKAALDSYLAFDISQARCLPNTYFFANISLAVLLIKLGHFGDMLIKLGDRSVSSGSTSTAQTFETTALYYLDAIVAKMEQVSSENHYPQAKPYITVLRKLKPYYIQKRAICVHPHGEPFSEDPEEEQNGSSSTHNGTKTNSTAYRAEIRNIRPAPLLAQDGQGYSHQLQSPQHNALQGEWTPAASERSDIYLPTPQHSDVTRDQLGSTPMNLDAAYDPSAYANTDWNALYIDPDAMEQLDSFLFQEEDNGWMSSFL